MHHQASFGQRGGSYSQPRLIMTDDEFARCWITNYRMGANTREEPRPAP